MDMTALKKEITSLPPRSRIRFLADLTESAAGTPGANSIFNTPLCQDEQRDLHAFDYAKGTDARAGGFGKNTPATSKHTTCGVKRKLPGNGNGTVFAIALQFANFVTRPTAYSNAAPLIDDALDDRAGKQVHTKDAVSGSGFVSALVQRLICEAYEAYFFKNDKVIQLPSMQMLGSGGAGIKSAVNGPYFDGPVLWIPEGIELTSGDEFFVGFKLVRDLKTHAVNPDGSAGVVEPTVTIRANLGFAAGANPVVAVSGGNGAILCCQDLDAYLLGNFDRVIT